MEIAQNLDWIFIPVLNVDGFVYTHEKVCRFVLIKFSMPEIIEIILRRIDYGAKPGNHIRCSALVPIPTETLTDSGDVCNCITYINICLLQ